MGKIGGSSWFKVVKRAFGSPLKNTDGKDEKRSKRREEQGPQEDDGKVDLNYITYNT